MTVMQTMCGCDTEEQHDFYNWFAGFADGEGCFDIVRSSTTGGFNIRFRIHLRSDEFAILSKIKSMLDCGNINTFNKQYGVAGYVSNTAMDYVISDREGCEKLCKLFTHHPLRAKKEKDFIIWKDALAYKIQHSTGGGHSNSNSGEYINHMETFKKQLSDVKAFGGAL